MEERTYEVSSKLDGFYWSACSKSTIFGNCKKRIEDKISCSDITRMKQIKDMGFVLTRREKL